MSLKAGNDHSSDDSGSTRPLQGMEISSWLLKHLRNRVRPLSSRSRIGLAMPSIASNIQRRVGHFSPRAIRLPILQAASIPTLVKPVMLSRVWGRLLDLTWFQRSRTEKKDIYRSANMSPYSTWCTASIMHHPVILALNE